jgi:hypothetical protein
MARKNYILVRNYLYVKKTFYVLFVYLIFITSSYPAGWEQIATGSNFKEYFKDAVRSGRTASIIAMRDYSSEMKQGQMTYLSVKKRYQFDCSRAKFRITLVEKYEKNKLEGGLSYASKTRTSWKKVSPNTLNEVAMKKACKKK